MKRSCVDRKFIRVTILLLSCVRVEDLFLTFKIIGLSISSPIMPSQILKENIQKVKLSTPDYKDMDEDAAMKDFMERRENYMAVYEPVTEADGPFCKIINSKQFIVNNIRGYLSLKVRGSSELLSSLGDKRTNVSTDRI